MKAPYIGKFKLSQEYKGSEHDGVDLVGLDNKEIRATVSGKVSRAGWENPADHLQGFGQYVRIDCQINGARHCAYYGHLKSVNVRVGDTVQVGDLLGIEGSTGNSSGSHVHYCIRRNGIKGQHIDICAFSGIPNAKGEYNGEANTEPVSQVTCPYPEPSQLVRYGTRGDAQAKLEQAQAVTDCKIDELTREVREHNGFAWRVPVLEEQMRVANHRLADLEK